MRCRDSSNSSETFANCGTVCSLHKRHSCLQITSVQQPWGPICSPLCLLLSRLGWISDSSICSISRLVFWEAQPTELRSNALVCLADLGKHWPKGIHLHLSYRFWRAVKNSCTPMYRPFRDAPVFHITHTCKCLQLRTEHLLQARAIDTITFCGGCQGSENCLMCGPPWLFCS